MISILLKKKELRLRRNILRGVYEDNLRITGKKTAVLSERTAQSLKKSIFFLSVFLIVGLGYMNYISHSVIQEDPIPVYKERSPHHFSLFLPTENLLNVSEYRHFFSSLNIPIIQAFGLKVRTIMIDPGHGGSFNGAVGKLGTAEKNLTLDIAKRLRDRLRNYGSYDVLLTRENDTTISLRERVDLARSSKADLFVSIHLNYLPNNPINMIETYIFGPASDDKTLRLVEMENADSQYSVSEFKRLIEKIGNTLKLQESKDLASSIQKNLYLNMKKKDLTIRNYGVKRAPFLVLLGVDVPAVLTEVSCLSNPEEEIRLNTDSYRESIAQYLEAGIIDYLNKGEIVYEAKRR